jgi:hypothetical protein
MCRFASAAERELLIRDRGERQPVERRDPVDGDRGAVLGCRVADVALELPARVPLGGAAHVAVTRHLGEDRGRGDSGALGVAVDHCPLLVAHRADPEAVDEADRLFARNLLERCPERLEVGPVESARVDAAHAAHHDRRLRRRPEDERVEPLAARLVVLLGVVQPGERAAVGQRQAVEVKQDRGRDERPGEAAAAGLVSTRDEAPLERPIEGE